MFLDDTERLPNAVAGVLRQIGYISAMSRYISTPLSFWSTVERGSQRSSKRKIQAVPVPIEHGSRINRPRDFERRIVPRDSPHAFGA